MALPITYRDFWYDERQHEAVIAASIDRFDDEPGVQASMMKFLGGPAGFGFRGLDGMRARSVASNGQFIWVVGKYGEVWTYAGASKIAHEDQLPDSGVRSQRHLGSPTRIRLIAGRPYVCGFAGQVYALSENRWVHMDDGVVEPEGTPTSLQLEGIHGTGPDDIVVVGSRGYLARWDGQRWSRITLLTNSFLAGVRAFSPDHVVAVGNDGAFVEWDGANWAVTQIPGYTEKPLADVEMFNGNLYVAAVDKLLVRRAGQNKWDSVPTSRLKESPEFFRLTVGDGRLWAMGAKRVHAFDGAKWEAFIDPDNG